MKSIFFVSKIFCVLLVLGAVNSVFATCEGKKDVPPIINDSYINAVIKLPKKWNGKSILANGFVYIELTDKKLQDKYNVHPGQRSPKDGEIYFDENVSESDMNVVGWDDDENFYEYQLSPNIVIEGGISGSGVSVYKNRKMTVSQFADYMRSIGYVEGKNDWGMRVHLTCKNGIITEIIETYND
jgi:hypothetical protein